MKRFQQIYIQNYSESLKVIKLRDIDKLNRNVFFKHVGKFVPADTTGKNNTWHYNRAMSGYVFKLISMDVSVSSSYPDGITAIFDGHEYTHWNIFPGVESRELLGRVETNRYQQNHTIDLHGWECKEYAIAIRSTNEALAYKSVVVVWFYLEKMNRLEQLYYAVIQPRFKRIKTAFMRTVESSELD